MVTVDEVESRLAALQSAVADLVDLPWGDVPIDGADAVVVGVESAQRTLSMVGYAALDRLRRDQPPGRGRRLRDHLANGLHISATEAAARIAAAADLAGEEPVLPDTAGAARHGLIGSEHVRIIRDTIDKLPDTASKTERARFDLELAAIAIAERPEVLRREAALLLAEYDATRDDPVTRERSRAARREVILGPAGRRRHEPRPVLSRPGGARLYGDRARPSWRGPECATPLTRSLPLTANRICSPPPATPENHRPTQPRRG